MTYISQQVPQQFTTICGFDFGGSLFDDFVEILGRFYSRNYEILELFD